MDGATTFQNPSLIGVGNQQKQMSDENLKMLYDSSENNGKKIDLANNKLTEVASTMNALLEEVKAMKSEFDSIRNMEYGTETPAEDNNLQGPNIEINEDSNNLEMSDDQVPEIPTIESETDANVEPTEEINNEVPELTGIEPDVQLPEINSDVPEVPAEPVAPEAPTVPELPTIDAAPVAPVAEVPAEPVALEAPAVPELPTVDAAPVAPVAEVPAEPVAPEAPAVPELPTVDAAPVAPVAEVPAEPVAPQAPAVPELPTVDVAPVAPVAEVPAEPVAPQAPIQENNDVISIDSLLNGVQTETPAPVAATPVTSAPSIEVPTVDSSSVVAPVESPVQNVSNESNVVPLDISVTESFTNDGKQRSVIVSDVDHNNLKNSISNAKSLSLVA